MTIQEIEARVNLLVLELLEILDYIEFNIYVTKEPKFIFYN